MFTKSFDASYLLLFTFDFLFLTTYKRNVNVFNLYYNMLEIIEEKRKNERYEAGGKGFQL